MFQIALKFGAEVLLIIAVVSLCYEHPV